jgi:formylglycine-generating enzyme required for sulfatase activity
MGAPDGDPDAGYIEKPQHLVTLTQPFYVGAHEVTVREFGKYVDATKDTTDAERDQGGSWGLIDLPDGGRNPSWTWRSPGFEQTEDHPVCCVTWEDANRFCAWLSAKEGREYRLPTEAQWEHACRAGTMTRYCFGDEMLPAELHNRAKGTAPVGLFSPNAFGLHDMHGNVYEWCHDGRRIYDQAPQIDPLGACDDAAKRVVRGGAWSSTPAPHRNALTSAGRPVTCARDRPFHGLGFRVILLPDTVKRASPVSSHSQTADQSASSIGYAGAGPSGKTAQPPRQSSL